MLKSTNASEINSFNSKKSLYLVIAIAGSIVPWYWLLQDPSMLLSPSLFLQQAFANNIATAFASDLIISAVAFLCFVWIELKHLKVSRLWLLLYIGLSFGIGLSCALPCYLYHREQILAQNG